MARNLMRNQQFKNDVKSGKYTVADIAKKYGITKQTVYYHSYSIKNANFKNQKNSKHKLKNLKRKIIKPTIPTKREIKLAVKRSRSWWIPGTYIK